MKIACHAEYCYVFRYMGEYYATDGIQDAWPDAIVRVEGDSRFILEDVGERLASLMGLAPSHLRTQRLSLPFGDSILATLGVDFGVVVSQQVWKRDRDQLTSLLNSRLLASFREIAWAHVYRRLIVHFVPNLATNIAQTTQSIQKDFVRQSAQVSRHVSTVKNIAHQIRATIFSADVLKPDWSPPIGSQQLFDQVRRQLAMVESTLTAKRVTHVFEGECYCHIRFGSSEMDTVLSNLMSNAAKYCKTGSELRLVFLRHQDGSLEIGLKQHSLFIEPNERELIFRLEYRGKRARGVSGFGLGLPVVKRILDAYNCSLVTNFGPELNGHADNYFGVRFCADVVVGD